jgi:hypothetical protein
MVNVVKTRRVNIPNDVVIKGMFMQSEAGPVPVSESFENFFRYHVMNHPAIAGDLSALNTMTNVLQQLEALPKLPCLSLLEPEWKILCRLVAEAPYDMRCKAGFLPFIRAVLLGEEMNPQIGGEEDAS